MHKNRLESYLPLIIVLSLPSCDGSGGGGITGTGSGYLIIDPIPVSQIAPIGEPVFAPALPGPLPACEPVHTNYGSVFPSQATSQILSPPNWLIGNWIASRENATTIHIVATSNEIFYGDMELQRPLSDYRRGVLELSKTELEYVYSVDANSSSIGDVFFEQKYEYIGNENVQYELNSSDFISESLQLTRQISANFLRPPDWLQGDWESDCGVRVITQNNIYLEFFDSDLTVDYMSILDSSKSTLSTIKNSNNFYEITGSYVPENTGVRLYFGESYRLGEEGQVIRTSYTYNDMTSSFFEETFVRQ